MTDMRFSPGDILCAATDVDDSNIDLRNHKGPGRLLHLGHDFKLKRAIFTGEEGLLVGLAQDPASGAFFVADPTGRKLFRISADGESVEPLQATPAQPFGTVAFDHNGAMYLGLHTHRGTAPEAPDGPDKWLRIDREGSLLDSYPVQTDGGHTGWHGVTSIAFVPGTRIALYVSEGGRRIPRYDVAARRQLDDLLVFSEGGKRRVFGVATAPDGRVIVAAGSGVLLLSPEGEELHWWPNAIERGWTRVTPAPDGTTFYLNNFLEGLIERRSLADGTVLAQHDIERKCALCGLVEIPASLRPATDGE